MAAFGNNTGFGSAASSAPRTVTYNAPPQSEAQYRSARLGSRVIAQTLGVAAWLLAIVALLMSWAFTSSLAVSWGEVVKLGLIGSALVAAMAGLPVASAMMARSYPIEARRAMTFWMVALLVVALSAIVFSIRLERPGTKDMTVRAHLAPPPAAPAVRSLYMTKAIWQGTQGCATMRDLYDQEVCGEYRDTLAARGVIEGDRQMVAEEPPSDWSPAGVLGVDSLATGATRQAIVLLLTLIATGGAGILGRWATLATAESYRLGEGMASALPVAAAPVAIAGPSGGASMSAVEVFNMWFAGRVRYNAQSRLAAAAIYSDYEQTCQLNGYPPVSAKQFGGLLTSKAEASGGRISKLRSNGNYYVGITLASSPEVVDSDYGTNGDGGGFGPAPYRH